MDIKEFISGVLSKTLNMDTDGVASLFNEDGSVKDDAEQTVLNLDADRVKGLKSGTQKTAFDDGYKKAQSEVLSKFENDFKAKTGIKSDKKGIDLVLEYATSQKPADAVTDDVIKRHPLYLTLQEEKESAIASAKAEGEEALKKFQADISKKETFGTVSQKILELFHKEKPILSKDPIKAKKQEELLLKEFKNFEFEIQGDRIVVLKDGKVLENAQGHAVQFDKLVKETANQYYDFHVAENKQAPGNQNQSGQEKKFNFEVPKTQEEYTKAILDPTKSVEERTAIQQAYKEANKTS